MSLLEPPAESSNKSRPMAFAIAAIAIIGIVVLWYTFRFYPENRAAQRFFDALLAGNTATAYKLWQPSESYKMGDFLADWGPNGYYGPVKSYSILKASAPRHGSGVAVEVAVSPFSPMPNKEDVEKS